MVPCGRSPMTSTRMFGALTPRGPAARSFPRRIRVSSFSSEVMPARIHSPAGMTLLPRASLATPSSNAEGIVIMPATTAQNLTLSQAAKIICRTNQPSADELAIVLRELEAGTLKGKRKGTNQWVVTTEDVAEYLANRAMQSRTRHGNESATAA